MGGYSCGRQDPYFNLPPNGFSMEKYHPKCRFNGLASDARSVPLRRLGVRTYGERVSKRKGGKGRREFQRNVDEISDAHEEW